MLRMPPCGIITSRRKPKPCTASLRTAERTLFPQFGADAPAAAPLLRSALRSAQKNCGIITSRREPQPCTASLRTPERTLNHSGTVKAVPDQGERHAVHAALWYNTLTAGRPCPLHRGNRAAEYTAVLNGVIIVCPDRVRRLSGRTETGACLLYTSPSPRD